MAKRQSFTVSEAIDELFMDYGSKHEPDEADDDSDTDFQADSDANETGCVQCIQGHSHKISS